MNLRALTCGALSVRQRLAAAFFGAHYVLRSATVCRVRYINAVWWITSGVRYGCDAWVRMREDDVALTFDAPVFARELAQLPAAQELQQCVPEVDP